MSHVRPVDFDRVNAAILDNLSYLERRLPGSRREGRELVCGDVQGSPGKSFKINLNTGRWADFSSGESGGDAVSLIAAQEGIGQVDAARKVSEDLGIDPAERKRKNIPESPVDWNSPTAVFPYYNPDGSHAFDVLRWETAGCRKTIRQSAGLDESGRRIPGIKGIELVPYNLVGLAGRPGVLESPLVVVVEGENKADALVDLGICATCNAGGAGKWKDSYSSFLKNKHVVIMPDNDDAGRNHAESVAASVASVAASVKLLALPSLPEKGDVIDWLRVDGNDGERLRSLINDAPYWKGQVEQGMPLDVDWRGFGGCGYMSYPERYEYLLKGAFLKRELGVIAGPPGAGKGTFALQMAVLMAAGLPVFEWWEVPERVRVLYVSAEDSHAVIHHRVYNALANIPQDIRRDAADRLVAIPVSGQVSLCQKDAKTGKVTPTDNMRGLKKIISEFRPGLVILDTLSRFVGVEENDNAAMTAACGLLENIIREHGCNIVLLHHTNKAAGDVVDDDPSLAAALSQGAIRGASALAGAVRFAIVLAPLGKKMAAKLFGDEAGEKPQGSYVSVRTVKKNTGAPEPYIHFARGEQGMLQRVEAVVDSDATEDDAYLLAEEVRRREEAGEPPLSVSKGGRDALKCGIDRGRKITATAIQLGLLETVEKPLGKGKVLKYRKVPTDRYFGLYNNDDDL